jgi:uncharacterized protein YigE (DUF2233 family)
VSKACAALAGVAIAGAIAAFASSALAAGAPCHAETFETSHFTVCRFDPTTQILNLAIADSRGKPLGSLAHLRKERGADAAYVDFAMNAGMYDRMQKPVGLYVVRGRTLRPLNQQKGSGNFYLLPNGVFWTSPDGAPHVDETGVFAAQQGPVAWATQSGPLLLAAGKFNPQITADGASHPIRNGVGVRGREAFFVISDDPVSFGRFARFFRDGLHCRDALYLDGTVSSLWAPALNRLDRRTGLGTFVVVMRKSGERR